MGKQSPNKRKSEGNSNVTPKKAKVVVDTPKTPVNSPVKQTPQKNNKTPKSQKKQKPQTPAKEPVMNGVASKKVQIKENNQTTPASTPAKGKGEKKYPVTPATKVNVVETPKSKKKGKKTPPGTPNKQNEGKLEKFAGVQSLDGSTAISPANIKKNQDTIIPTEVATGLNKRQMKRMRLKLRKVAIVGTKKESVEKKASDSATNKSIKEIAENVAEGEKPMSKSQKRRLKKMQKLATAANAEATNKPENSNVQSPKAKKNKKKGKNQTQQANGNQVAAVKTNENAKNKKQKGNQKKETQQQQQQQQQKKKKQKVEQKKVEAEEDNKEESDYEVETSIKPEKVSKKMNETEDSDNEGAAVLDTGDEEMEDESDDEDDNEETDNSVNENNENEQKDQKKPKKQKNKNAKGTQAAPENLNDAGIITKGQSRYVLFVGNLPFDANKQQVTEHFNKTCEVKDVRIPTDKQSNKPRGFAYLEVPNEDSYHKALALHHSFVNGRRINVLYTQGGTKNSDDMKQKIKSKNFKLQAMRRDGKLPGGVKDSQKRSVRRAKKRSFDKNTE